MRNRAKCKLCKEILESFHLHDEIECKCGEIRISGGSQKYLCFAKNWDNFVRLDETDKEIAVKVVEKDEEVLAKAASQDKDMVPPPIKELGYMIEYLEGLPVGNLDLPMTQRDNLWIMKFLYGILTS